MRFSEGLAIADPRVGKGVLTPLTPKKKNLEVPGGFPANIAIITFLITLTPEAAPERRRALGCVHWIDTDLPQA